MRAQRRPVLTRRDLLRSAAVGGAALTLGPTLLAGRPRGRPLEQGFPFVRRPGFLDIGVPVPEGGDPGSSSLSSSVGEPGLGLVFDVLEPFTLVTASIAMGIRGAASLGCSVHRVEPGSLDRVDVLFDGSVETSGTTPFNLLNRLCGTREPDHTGDWTWSWFDVPVDLPLRRGDALELMFKDFAITRGSPVRADWNNWLSAHPLYDTESRAYGRPYEVGGLIRVFDGSIRGVVRDGRFAYVPMALIRVGRDAGPARFGTR